MSMCNIRYCVHCGDPFESKRAHAKYCSRICEGKEYRKRVGLICDIGRHCKQCGSHFFPPVGENNKLHCSDVCAKKSATESRTKFWDKQSDPEAKKKIYYARSLEKTGADKPLKRFYTRFPDASKVCQSCGDGRVLDIAHKPEHKRNGAWPSAKNTTIEKVWILCPTCHALLDRLKYSPADMGLK